MLRRRLQPPTPTASTATARLILSRFRRRFPVRQHCLPDAPGGFGCPLYVPEPRLPPGSAVDCAKVCDEYGSCKQSGGIQAGFTCDATLCTDECNDRDLRRTRLLRAVQVRHFGNRQSRNRGDLQLLREPAMRMQPERENQHGDRDAEPAAARSADQTSMRYQWDAVRNAVTRLFFPFQRFRVHPTVLKKGSLTALEKRHHF